MKLKALLIPALLAFSVRVAFAQEGPVPTGVPALDHVWVIMMENHGFSQVLHNPAAPFTTKYANSANLATNYFAVAHPSLTNYLETNGGSNFGVLDDNSPDWHNGACSPTWPRVSRILKRLPLPFAQFLAAESMRPRRRSTTATRPPGLRV